MTEILLVNPFPKLRKPDSAEPLPLLYLAAQLEKEGMSPTIFDCAVTEITLDDLEGFTVFGVTAVTPQYPEALRLLQLFKQYEQNVSFPIHTIIGGPHVTVFREKVLQDGWTTACAGEGEKVITDIVNKKISGLVDGTRVDNLDTLPLPSRHLIKPSQYLREGATEPSMSVLGTRGCPYSCIYCAKEVNGKKVRFRSPDNIINEIEDVVANYGIRNVVFYDDTFTLDSNRTKILCQKLEKLNISWICNTRADRVNRQVLADMKKAGCQEISFGIESANQRVLDFANKGITVKQAQQAIQLTKDSGIRTRVFLMYGFFEDDKDSASDMLNFLEGTQPDAARLSLLVPLPGTKLYQNSEEYGIKLPDDYGAYYYAGINGPHTFIDHTKHLNPAEFRETLELLQQGFIEWATKKNGGSARITNVQVKSK